MGSLDDKLIKALEGSDTFALTDDPKNSEYMKRIKQAFADEGYYKTHTSSPEAYKELAESMFNDLPKLMTGSQWLERFENEMAGSMFPFKHGGGEDIRRAVAFCREAAKKASGIDNG